jgi:hypothetical protein
MRDVMVRSESIGGKRKSQGNSGITAQKAAILMATTVRTRNPTHETSSLIEHESIITISTLFLYFLGKLTFFTGAVFTFLYHINNLHGPQSLGC